MSQCSWERLLRSQQPSAKTTHIHFRYVGQVVRRTLSLALQSSERTVSNSQESPCCARLTCLISRATVLGDGRLGGSMGSKALGGRSNSCCRICQVAFLRPGLFSQEVSHQCVMTVTLPDQPLWRDSDVFLSSSTSRRTHQSDNLTISTMRLTYAATVNAVNTSTAFPDVRNLFRCRPSSSISLKNCLLP